MALSSKQNAVHGSSRNSLTGTAVVMESVAGGGIRWSGAHGHSSGGAASLAGRWVMVSRTGGGGGVGASGGSRSMVTAAEQPDGHGGGRWHPEQGASGQWKHMARFPFSTSLTRGGHQGPEGVARPALWSAWFQRSSSQPRWDQWDLDWGKRLIKLLSKSHQGPERLNKTD